MCGPFVPSKCALFCYVFVCLNMMLQGNFLKVHLVIYIGVDVYVCGIYVVCVSYIHLRRATYCVCGSVRVYKKIK